MQATLSSSTTLHLIAQYLYENNLHDTLSSLVLESKQISNPLGPHALSAQDVLDGHWESVLRSVECDVVATDLAFDLLEQICWELGPVHSLELVTKSPLLQIMKLVQPARHAGLSKPPADAVSRRQALADKIQPHEQRRLRPGRLVACLGDALRYKRLQVMSDDPLGLYSEPEPEPMSEHVFPTRLIASSGGKRKGVTIECAALSLDGLLVATWVGGLAARTHTQKVRLSRRSPHATLTLARGSRDGLIEVWDSHTLKRRKDVELAAPGGAVLCLNFGWNELLVAGDQGGHLVCFQALKPAATLALGPSAVLCVAVETGAMLCGQADGLARLVGLVSKQVTCELRGHAEPVNAVGFTSKNRLVATASKDGTARLWTRVGECVARFDAKQPLLRLLCLRSNTSSGVAASLRPEPDELLLLGEQGGLWRLGAGDARSLAAWSSPAPLVDVALARSGCDCIGVASTGRLLGWDQTKLVRDMDLSESVQQAVAVLQLPAANRVVIVTQGGALHAIE